MEDDVFGKKNVYAGRTSDKRYLAKKKRHNEKNALPLRKEVSEMVFVPEDSSGKHWRVAEIRQGISHRTIECVSPQSEASRAIDLPFNDPLFDQVVIGDYVIVEKDALSGIVCRKNLLARYKGDQNRFSIHSRLKQPIAANLDAIVIVASAKDPAFQPGFIDRYMVLAEQSGIPAIICISKSDLKPINDPILHWYENELRIPVVHTSSVSREGMEKLMETIKGKTVAFVGKSGVGKSSLTNVLL